LPPTTVSMAALTSSIKKPWRGFTPPPSSNEVLIQRSYGATSPIVQWSNSLNVMEKQFRDVSENEKQAMLTGKAVEFFRLNGK